MLSILKHSNVFYLFLNGTFMFVVFFRLCSGNFLWGWFRNMRTVYGKLRKKKNEQATRPLTARQRWTSDMFKFLDKHMTIRRSSLGKVE